MRSAKHRRQQGGNGKSLEEMEAEFADGPKDRARRGRLRLAVAAVVFATLVLPKLVGPESYTGAAPALPRANSAATDSPSPSDSRGPGGSGPAGSSASGTPAEAAFRSVRTGQCLSVHRDRDGRGWSAASPSESLRVDCGAADALVRVSSVKGDPADCPAGQGESHWSPPGGRSRSNLCLTRQFRQDDCLFAGPGTSPGREEDLRVDLMSAPHCGTRKIPDPYDRVLTVTGIRPDVARPAPRGVCARGTHDRTRYQNRRVGDGTVLCTAERAEAGRRGNGAD